MTMMMKCALMVLESQKFRWLDRTLSIKHRPWKNECGKTMFKKASCFGGRYGLLSSYSCLPRYNFLGRKALVERTHRSLFWKAGKRLCNYICSYALRDLPWIVWFSSFLSKTGKRRLPMLGRPHVCRGQGHVIGIGTAQKMHAKQVISDRGQQV